MTRRCARVIGIAFVLLVPSSAQAVTITRADGVTSIPRLQRLIDGARVPTAAGAVRVVYGRDSDHEIYTRDDRTIHVGREKMTDETFFHEMGHDFDFYALTDRGFWIWRLWTGERRERDEKVGDIQTASVGDDGSRWLAREHFADWYGSCASKGYSLAAIVMKGIVMPDDVAMTSYGLIVSRKSYRQSCKHIWQLPRGES